MHIIDRVHNIMYILLYLYWEKKKMIQRERVREFYCPACLGSRNIFLLYEDLNIKKQYTFTHLTDILVDLLTPAENLDLEMSFIVRSDVPFLPKYHVCLKSLF